MMLTQNNPLISFLAQAEFAHLRFECRMGENAEIDTSTILRLRRRLRGAVKEFLPSRADMLRYLFEPELPTDPQALRRYQKGAPAFVVMPESIRQGWYFPGETLSLDIRLLGNVARQVQDLIEVFVALGKAGLRLDAGKYTLERVYASDAAGSFTQVWENAGASELQNVPRLDLGWWLEDQPQTYRQMKLEFCTPARLLIKGRPMFGPDMEQLFPFVLRRVTSMLYTHCEVELDPVGFETGHEIKRLDCVENKLYWNDWRYLHVATGKSKPLGGVYGSLRVQGNMGCPLLSIFQIGSLLNLGKNAAYGAGSYSIEYIL